MRNPVARGLVGLAALAAVVVLFVVLAGGDDDSSDNTGTTQTQPATGATVTTGQGQADSKPKKPATPRIVVVGGKPRGGVQRLS
jgi:hypothetical protein